jgi:hypothetical protein
MPQVAARSFRTVLLAIGLTSMVVGAPARPATAGTGDVQANGPATRVKRATGDVAPVAPKVNYDVTLGKGQDSSQARGTLEWTNAGVLVNGWIDDKGPGDSSVTFSAFAYGKAYYQKALQTREGRAPTNFGIPGDFPHVVVTVCKWTSAPAAQRCASRGYEPPGRR